MTDALTEKVAMAMHRARHGDDPYDADASTYWSGIANAAIVAVLKEIRKQFEPVPTQHGPWLPRYIAEILHEAYDAKFPNCQTLERLLERGGFSWGEAALWFYRALGQGGLKNDIKLRLLKKSQTGPIDSLLVLYEGGQK